MTMPITRLFPVAAAVSLVAAIVAVVLSALVGLPEQLLVIATILVATEIGWRLADARVATAAVPRSHG
jgi:hypothetical protein